MIKKHHVLQDGVLLWRKWRSIDNPDIIAKGATDPRQQARVGGDARALTQRKVQTVIDNSMRITVDGGSQRDDLVHGAFRPGYDRGGGRLQCRELAIGSAVGTGVVFGSAAALATLRRHSSIARAWPRIASGSTSFIHR